MPEPIVPAPMTTIRFTSRAVTPARPCMLGTVALGKELVAQGKGFTRYAQLLKDRSFSFQRLVDRQ